MSLSPLCLGRIELEFEPLGGDEYSAIFLTCKSRAIRFYELGIPVRIHVNVNGQNFYITERTDIKEVQARYEQGRV